MTKQLVKAICAALLLALGFASPAMAQMCSDGEVLIVASHLDGPPGGTSGYEIRELPVNLGFNGENGRAIYDQLVVSDAFRRGGVLDGFKPSSVLVSLGEFSHAVMGHSGAISIYGVGAQLLQCSSAKKLGADSWRRYCDDGRFLPGIYVMSGKAVRPFDMDKLPINPQRCSDPSRLGDPDFALRAGYRHWAPIDSDIPDFDLAYYLNPDWQTGNLAFLYSSGTRSHDGNTSAKVWPYSQNDIMISLAVTSGDEPITGFEGVTLRAADSGKDLETFFSTITDSYKAWQFSGEQRCGVGTLGQMANDQLPMCQYKCYLTRDDLIAGRNAVSCINGNAHWIGITIAGALYQKHALPPAERGASQVRREMDVIQRKEAAARKRRGELTLTEKVERAGSLAVHVKWKGSDAVAIPVDDYFRTSLWSPEK